jgi:gamma-glutamylcyclotransferase (GGCT)/AIG2-like uncharacterized protein YtfP
VFGTLKRGRRNEHYLAGARFAGEGWIEGFRLYRLGAPFIVETGRAGDRVFGEIYEVNARMLTAVDGLEGCTPGDEGGFYVRREILQLGCIQLYVTPDHHLERYLGRDFLVEMKGGVY